jgi:hypothetical protein
LELLEEEGDGGGLESGVVRAKVGGEVAEELGPFLVGLWWGQVQRAGLEDSARDGDGSGEVGVDVDSARTFSTEGDLILILPVSLDM